MIDWDGDRERVIEEKRGREGSREFVIIVFPLPVCAEQERGCECFLTL